MAAENDAFPKKEPIGEKKSLRDWLALVIIGVAGGGVLVLAALMIYLSDVQHRRDTAQLVMTGVLPLLGVWVGTILAYYFSKENLQAATESFTKVAALRAPEEKLKAITVKTVMIKKDEMFFKTLPEDKIKLVATLEEIKATGKGQRLPILDDRNRVVYMVHKSAIDGFITTMATSPSPPRLEDLTLKDMLDKGGNLRGWLESSFTFVNEAASLEDAKAAMERTNGCQDVFVTAGGTKDEPVLGWITNEIIQKNAKL